MAIHPNSLKNLEKRRSFRTSEEAKENGRKGGIATKKNADRIREHQERMLAILDTEDFTGMTLQERLDRGLIRLVIDNGPGATAAYEKLMEISGKSVLLELKREEQKIKREELKLKKEEIELKKAQAEAKAGDVTDIEDLSALAEMINEPDQDD